MNSEILEINGQKLEFLPPVHTEEVREMGIECRDWQGFADMTYAQTAEYCKKTGVRLPTAMELYALHLQIRKGNVGWPTSIYWSSTANSSDKQCYANLLIGCRYSFSDIDTGYVACVREI